MGYLEIIALAQTILDIVKLGMQTDLAELNALPDAAKAVRAAAMAQQQADVRAFWGPSINMLLSISAKFQPPLPAATVAQLKAVASPHA
jgi:hypothetical protein